MACRECFYGVERDDRKPLGRETKIHGRDTYVANPPGGADPKGYVIIVPDAFGWRFVNNKILADIYAEKGGYRVYLPDFMDGTAAPTWLINSMYQIFEGPWLTKPYHTLWTLWSFVPFLVKNSWGKAMPKVQSYCEAVRQNEAATLPIGVTGFCWGGKHAINLADGRSVAGKPLVDASFIAHPSSLEVEKEFGQLKKPLAVAIGDKDFVMSMKEVHQAEGILKKLSGQVKSDLRVYPGAGHGFAVRADPGTKQFVEQAKEAEDHAMGFFADVFASVKY